jgi:hypothetical protein
VQQIVFRHLAAQEFQNPRILGLAQAEDHPPQRPRLPAAAVAPGGPGELTTAAETAYGARPAWGGRPAAAAL